jgi:hypothetical protein
VTTARNRTHIWSDQPVPRPGASRMYTQRNHTLAKITLTNTTSSFKFILIAQDENHKYSHPKSAFLLQMKHMPRTHQIFLCKNGTARQHFGPSKRSVCRGWMLATNLGSCQPKQFRIFWALQRHKCTFFRNPCAAAMSRRYLGRSAGHTHVAVACVVPSCTTYSHQQRALEQNTSPYSMNFKGLLLKRA